MFNMDYKYKHVHQIHKWPSTFRIDCMWDCVAWPDTWPWPWTGQSSLEAAMWDCVACHVRLCSAVGLMCTLIAVWQSSGQPDHLTDTWCLEGLFSLVSIQNVCLRYRKIYKHCKDRNCLVCRQNRRKKKYRIFICLGYFGVTTNV